MQTQKMAPVLLVSLLIVAASTFAVAWANPLRTPMIKVNSPTNNYVYSIGDVWLQFEPLSGTDLNFTSFSYSLDDQDAQPANGNTLLTNLSAGSHKVTIYGNATNGWNTYDKMYLEVVYFNVNYSEAWVTFTLSFSVFIAVVSLGLFVNRKRLIMRLRGKKNAFFWLGLCGVVFVSLFLVPMGWTELNNYLFPHDTRGAITIYLGPFIAGFLVLLCVGLLLMAIGTMKINFPKWEPPHPKKK